MSAQSRDHISDLERHRLRLEEQIDKLRKSLQHWQTWDAEYEGLKEEIQGFKKTPDGPDPTAKEMIQLGHEFGGELVNDKEIKELLGKDMQRSAKQVIDLISRRQDYVQKNVETVQKQVDAAEDKLSKVLIVSNPSLENDEGAPLMDIREELDEDGNVVSSSVSTPGQQTAQIMETLKKAGIELPDEETKKDEETSGAAESSTPDASTTEVKTDSKTKPSKTSNKVPIQAESSSSASQRPEIISRKKSVSFAPDTKEPAEPSGVPDKKASFTAHMNFPPGSRVVELNDKDEVVGAEIAGSQNPGIQHAVIPENESPEDAKLRREMLEYSLNEVGSVVAELDLYEGDSDDDDVYEYEEEDSDIEEVEEEDEWGRSRPVITEEYLQKMRELEEELDARMIENIGPSPEDADLNNVLQQAQGVHKLVVRTDEEIPPALLPKQTDKPKSTEPKQNNDTIQPISTSPEPAPKGEKGVRFADSLDVSPAPQPSTTTPPTTTTPEGRPIADAIIERSTTSSSSTTTTPTPSESAPPRKASRFKAARAAQPPTPVASSFPADLPTRATPTGPPNATLASSVVERDASTTAATTAPDPDGLDPATLSQEALASYHALRNKFIQRQEGGFVRPSDEEEEAGGPMVEEREDGSVRKVSRFRAARVKGMEGL
ncbi:Udp-galactose transporter like protein [Neofusicoccum parvum]|uniref:Udp-galactose transporter like protein n=1 Tax=Neofusicoccum parvum TaxID=310453 RepID=A0ACB5RSX7_9PEZI|nr:Udp-galactose transporter like protein [Neofusicoccum parvum]